MPRLIDDDDTDEIQDERDQAVAAEAVPFLADDLDELPTDGTAYLYTTDPRCTWGKSRALLDKITLPVDPLSIQRRFGGGPYEILVKGRDGRMIACKRFALAGPSRLRELVTEAGADETPGDGAFWQGLQAAKSRRADDDRIGRLEKLVEKIASAPAATPTPSAADQLMLKLAEASILKATTQQTAGPIGQTLKELLEAQALLENLAGPREEPGILASIAAALPQLLTLLPPPAAPAPAAAAAPAAPRALPAPAAPKAPPAPPAPQDASQAPPAASPPPGPDLTQASPEQQAIVKRLLAILRGLAEAVQTQDPLDEWAEWAADAAGEELREMIADEPDPIGALVLLASMAGRQDAIALVQGPGRPYLERAVRLIREELAEPSPAAE